LKQPILSKSKAAVGDPLAEIYADKPSTYFDGTRLDIVGELEVGNQSILELGCGSGGTGSAALAAGKAQRYVGIELDAKAAAVASERITEVLVGDVTNMDLGAFAGAFDVLIMSEVLEHLPDPWGTLQQLVACLKPGGRVYASSPNVAHRHVLMNLVRGSFDYAGDGVMDRTHLRWFTPTSFRQMFEEAGVRVTSVGPVVRPGWKAQLIDRLTGGRIRHLFIVQIMVRGVRR
jgi:2-polyprenyl-3-methyl-5-hydroxy-6-metoxy-1,4-benzoquinol methylase